LEHRSGTRLRSTSRRSDKRSKIRSYPQSSTRSSPLRNAAHVTETSAAVLFARERSPARRSPGRNATYLRRQRNVQVMMTTDQLTDDGDGDDEPLVHPRVAKVVIRNYRCLKYASVEL